MRSLILKKKMHVDFDPLQVDWSTTFSDDDLLVQFGGYNVFRGIPYQRGGGVGSLFRSLMRRLLPIGKQIGAAIGRQGLESGNRVLTNVLDGKDVKESLVTEGTAGLKNLLEKAASKLDQKGQGFDFKRYRQKEPHGKIGKITRKHINKLQSPIGPQKRLRVDSLGTY